MGSPHTLRMLEKFQYGDHIPDCLAHPEVAPNPCLDHEHMTGIENTTLELTAGHTQIPQAQLITSSEPLALVRPLSGFVTSFPKGVWFLVDKLFEGRG